MDDMENSTTPEARPALGDPEGLHGDATDELEKLSYRRGNCDTSDGEAGV